MAGILKEFFSLYTTEEAAKGKPVPDLTLQLWDLGVAPAANDPAVANDKMWALSPACGERPSKHKATQEHTSPKSRSTCHDLDENYQQRMVNAAVSYPCAWGKRTAVGHSGHS
ncbi:hypothetical protein Q8A67_019083 [Cirrhinus molitorella]|uniref:Uncharacterized protein n=1 Tax=Cirrhinus molitorella TaxID=172907 RepID=A0AA88THK9_9TELE|nr:hypothetical protein Q8A67_019083 [Cirrhinus molitorella]